MNWLRLSAFHMTLFDSWRHPILLKDFLFHWHCLLLWSSIANSRRVSFPFVCDFIAWFLYSELNWISWNSCPLCCIFFTLDCVSHPSIGVKKLCFRASNANKKETKAWHFNSSRIEKCCFFINSKLNAFFLSCLCVNNGLFCLFASEHSWRCNDIDSHMSHCRIYCVRTFIVLFCHW